jgi:hypothetical protein
MRVMTDLPTCDAVRSVLHYDPETGVFTNKIDRNPRAPAGSIAGYTNTIGYTVIQIGGRKLHAHRLAWLYMTGEWPKCEIDHINRVRSDNRFTNLRQATSTQNKHNTTDRITNTSGHRGVTWHKHRNKWQAQISVAGTHHYLGMFDNIEDAVAARENAVALFHDYAKTVKEQPCKK